jgi:hypothetical protein
MVQQGVPRSNDHYHAAPFLQWFYSKNGAAGVSYHNTTRRSFSLNLTSLFTVVALGRRAPWFRWPSLSAEIGAARSTFAETLFPRQVTL